MKNLWKRLVSGSLALVLAGSLALPGLAAPSAEAPGDPGGEAARPLAITVGSYTPQKGYVTGDVDAIQRGQTYTLIALPASIAATGSTPKPLTPAQLVSATHQALFIGSAVASGKGQVTFEDVRLRTSEAAVYYVTGPGLNTPLAEVTGLNVGASGSIRAAAGDHSAQIALVDAETGYRYSNYQYADAQSGAYSFTDINPGTYDLYIAKPGYLPFTHKSVEITDDGTSFIRTLNISANVGDVTNDGVRDLTDLAALLLYYGKSAALAPAGRTPDLNADGTVTQADVELLIPHLTTSSATQAQDALISVADTGAEDDATLRCLTFSIQSQAPVSAAAFSITYSADTIQPLNEKGGMVAPVDGGSLANCLVPAQGYTAKLTGWRINGSLVTLSFGLTADTPHAQGAMAQFYYRPVSGSAKTLYPGVFALDQAAALVGRDTVVTSARLTHPNSDSSLITTLTIDQRPADGHAVSIDVPTAGQSYVMPLTATGSNATETFPNLPGVSWQITRSDGLSTDGVTAAQSQLTITSQAAAGQLSIVAVQGEVTSQPLLVDLNKAPSYPDTIAILRDEQTMAQDEILLDFETVDLPYVQYAARIRDQYGHLMDGQSVTWTLSGAPSGVNVGADGRVTANKTVTPAGTYTFSLRAQCGEAQAVASLTLSVRIPPKALSISGTKNAVIPTDPDQPLTLNYVISAVDLQDRPMSIDGLAPSLTVSPADRGVTATFGLSGTFVTIDPTALAGTYTLTAQINSGGRVISTDFDLKLTADPSQTAARAVLYQGAQNAASQTFSFPAGKAASVTFTPKLLNAEDKPINSQPGDWAWLLTPTTPGLTLPARGAEGTLSIASTLAAGSYHLELTATEQVTGLEFSVKAPITLVITPVLAELHLSGPESGSLILPVGNTLTYNLALDAADVNGQPMELPRDLQWSVTAKGSSQAPAGVTVADGVLTVTSAAKAGVITVTVTDKEGKVTSSTDITLTSATSGSILTLSRVITVEGKEVATGPVSGGKDAVDLKEGSTATFTYTASLHDQSTGAVEDVTDQVTWLGGRRTFSVDANDEAGVYPAVITAVYAGQSVSVTAQASVFPNITAIRPYFGEGIPTTMDQVSPPYTLTIPNVTAKTYSAKLMAVIRRDGADRLIPLSDLGLSDYELTMSTSLVGITAAVNKTDHTLQVTVDPSALQNSMADPAPGGVDARYISLYLQYFPGETVSAERLALRLERNEAELKQAVFRYGAGSGTSFAFDTAKPTAQLSLPAGSLTGCYGLEILDQYNRPVKNQLVNWKLEGAPKDANGNYLISIFNPTDTLSAFYPNYAGIRRLAIHPDTPAGTYDLILSVSAAGFAFSQELRLTVGAAASDQDLVLTLAGKSIPIPQFFLQPGSTAVNEQTNTGTFLATLTAPDGSYEVYPLGWQFAWSVTEYTHRYDTNGNLVSVTPTTPAPGVTVTPGKDGTGVAQLAVGRYANYSSDTYKHEISLTAVSPTGRQYPSSGDPATATLTLTRNAAVPYLLTLRYNGRDITQDSITLSSSQSSLSRVYEYVLRDQYNYPFRGAHTVNWTLNGNVSNTTRLISSPAAAKATVAVSDQGKNASGTATLTARVKADGCADLTAAVKLNVTVNSKTQGGNQGGNQGGGPTTPMTPTPKPSPTPSLKPSPSPTPSVAPPPVSSEGANVVLTPPMSQSGFSGSASLTADQEKSLNESTASGGTVTIAPTGGGSLTSVSVSLTSATAKSLAAQKNRTLRIQTTLGTVRLSPEALNALANRGGANTTITLSLSGGVLKVDFSCGSTAATLPGVISLSAPTSGNVAIQLNPDGSEILLKKAVVDNNRILTRLNGSTQLRLETRTPSFTDIRGHWAQSAVNFTAARELFQGTSATTFSPDNTMTRSMLVTVLHRLEDTPAATATATFADVPGSAWYANAVTWANTNGIVQGTNSGFKPDDPVTREQLATILFRYMNSQKLSTSGRNNLYAFSDRDRVSPWAREAVEWAVAAGLIQGKSGGVLDPGGNATRAEVSTILERLIRSMAPTV